MSWGGFAEKMADLLLMIKGRKNKYPPFNVFNDGKNVTTISEGIIDSGLSVDCFLLMLAHNGGKKLNPVNLKYRTVMGGDYNEVQMRNFDKDNYKNLPIDYEWNEIMSAIYDDRRKNLGVVVKVSEASGRVKEMLLYENLKYVKFYFVHYSEDGMWYLMIGTTQDDDMDDVEHKGKIYFAVNQIKDIIKNY